MSITPAHGPPRGFQISRQTTVTVSLMLTLVTMAVGGTMWITSTVATNIDDLEASFRETFPTKETLEAQTTILAAGIEALRLEIAGLKDGTQRIPELIADLEALERRVERLEERQ